MTLGQRLERRLRTPEPPLATANADATSVSREEPGYLDVCRRAPGDPRLFASFRRHPEYTRVLEHASEAQGTEYHRLLSRSGRAFRSIAEAVRNDVVGEPLTMRLDSGEVISPTTLRYLKVADDLERMFGSLDGFSIVEIGVGYGGQCRILDALFELKSYTLVDLRPVLGLAEEYLSWFPLRTSVSFQTMNELQAEPRDLALSNYAFSELSRELQETYLRKALVCSTRGYITFNDIAPGDYRTLSGADLQARLGASSFPEEPLTHPKNSIIAWGLPA
jgi:hypothetical protein